MLASHDHRSRISAGARRASQHGMRALVVAAHPDDETIGASALLGAPHETIVLHATDGAPRDPRWWPAGISDRDEYASVRALEAARALALAGASCIPLRVVDQEAACALRELVAAISDHIARLAPDVIITHAYEGGHPDHDAVAFAVARARERLGRDVPVYEMALYHAAHGALIAGEFIDGRRPPHDGVLHYEAAGFSITGEQWRALASAV
jgi:LmbE family N-acetylglucosaminyl deacetylase